MSADYVDKIKKGVATYDVKDPRLPDAAVADEGKALVVDSNGGYTLGEGGTKLYKHTILFDTPYSGSSSGRSYTIDTISFISTSATPVTDINDLITYNYVSGSPCKVGDSSGSDYLGCMINRAYSEPNLWLVISGGIPGTSISIGSTVSASFNVTTVSITSDTVVEI